MSAQRASVNTVAGYTVIRCEDVRLLSTRGWTRVVIADSVIAALTAGLLIVSFTAAGAQARVGEEQELIAVLQSTADVSQKCAACQRLRIVGTSWAVAPLATLLCDEGTAHAARYALESIPGAEASRALRDAAQRTSGAIQLGLIDTLGWRRDRDAMPWLTTLVASPDATTVAAAATALSRIGGSEAIAALREAQRKGPAAALPNIWEGLLRCAEASCAENDAATAIGVYRALLSDALPTHFRLAAWRGLVRADSDRRSERIATALADDDATLRAAARQALAELGQRQVVQACVDRWASLPADSQVAVLDMLGPFGASMFPTALAALHSSDSSVRVAGLLALGEMNTPRAVAPLAQALGRGGPAERLAAREALTRLHGPDIDAALNDAIAQATDARSRAELLNVLGQRGETNASDVLLAYAADTDEPVRLAALAALQKLAPEAALDRLLDGFATEPSSRARDQWVKTLCAICQNTPDKARATASVLGALRGDANASDRHLLPVLSALGTPDALRAAAAAARAPDLALAKDAVRALADWPDVGAAPELLDVAERSPDPTLHALALRGYIKLASLESEAAKLVPLMRQALSAARRPEEKRLALAQLGQIASPGTLDLALAQLEQDGVGHEAAMAALTIAEQLAHSQPQMIADATARILAHPQPDDIVRRVWALSVKPQPGPFLRRWLVCGLYRQSGVTGAQNLFPIPFGPEKPDEKVLWRPAPPADIVNLAAIFPGQDDCVAYLKTHIIAPQGGRARLLLGSDDGVQAWLNGAVVHANNTDRATIPDEDTAVITLNPGVNVLMLKITQGRGGWAMCARIVAPDGTAIAGVDNEVPPVEAVD